MKGYIPKHAFVHLWKQAAWCSWCSERISWKEKVFFVRWQYVWDFFCLFIVRVFFQSSDFSIGCLLTNSPRKRCALFFVPRSNLVYLIELLIWLNRELDFLSYHYKRKRGTGGERAGIMRTDVTFKLEKKNHLSLCRLPWRLLDKDWLSSIPHPTPPWHPPLHRNEWEPPDKKVDTRKYRAEPKSIFEYEPGKSSVLKLERTVC